MKSRHVFTSMVLLLFCVTVALLPAAGQKTGPKYDPSTETKIKGTIEEIKTIPGDMEGIHVVLKTANGNVLVHMAPKEFLDLVECNLKQGDEIEVTGSKVTLETGEEFLAKEIQQGNNVTTLRDKKGNPAWAGMKLK